MKRALDTNTEDEKSPKKYRLNPGEHGRNCILFKGSTFDGTWVKQYWEKINPSKGFPYLVLGRPTIEEVTEIGLILEQRAYTMVYFDTFAQDISLILQRYTYKNCRSDIYHYYKNPLFLCFRFIKNILSQFPLVDVQKSIIDSYMELCCIEFAKEQRWKECMECLPEIEGKYHRLFKK